MNKGTGYPQPWWNWIKREVLQRDEYRCTKCGSGRKVQVHHLKYSEFDGQHHTVVSKDNLTTLCRCCHVAEHNIKDGSMNSLLKNVSHTLRFMR